MKEGDLSHSKRFSPTNLYACMPSRGVCVLPLCLQRTTTVLCADHGSHNVSRWMTWLPISLKNAAKCDNWYQLQNHSITESLNAKGAREKSFSDDPRACRISVSNNNYPKIRIGFLLVRALLGRNEMQQSLSIHMSVASSRARGSGKCWCRPRKKELNRFLGLVFHDL